jgi:hypothetical protein
MMRGKGDVVTGWHNKLQAAIALVTPSDMLAEQHRRAAERATPQDNVIAETALPADNMPALSRHSRGSSR